MGPGGLTTHQGHMNGLGGGPGGNLSNGPNSGPSHLPIPTPPIHTSNPSSLQLGSGQNGPHPLPPSMIGGPNSSNNGIGLPPLPSMSSGKS